MTPHPRPAGRPGDLGPIGPMVVDLPDRPGLHADHGTILGQAGRLLTRGRRSSVGGDPRRLAMDRPRPGDRPAESRPDRPGLRARPAPPVRRPRRRRRARDPRPRAGPATKQQSLAAFSVATGPPALDRDGRRRLPNLGHDVPCHSMALAGRPRRRRPDRGHRPRLRPDAAARRLPGREGARRAHRPDPLGPPDEPRDQGRGRPGPPPRGARPGRRRRPRPDRRLAVRRPESARVPRRTGDPSPRGPTSMRSRARTAACSGPGTRTCRKASPPTSGRPDGGAAARTAGRCWPSRSAARSRPARRDGPRPRTSIPPAVHVLEASTGASGTGSRGWAAPASPTWTATA